MKRIQPWLVLVLCALVSGCSFTKGAFMEGLTDSHATDRVLRVTSQPVSLGYKRLGYHSEVSPGLAKFLQMGGYPDYLIEGRGFTTRQIVMFYLKTNHAYLAEIHLGQLQVKGPEPIGTKTRALLDALGRLEQTAEVKVQKTTP